VRSESNNVTGDWWSRQGGCERVEEHGFSRALRFLFSFAGLSPRNFVVEDQRTPEGVLFYRIAAFFASCGASPYSMLMQA
jgi:hypothetical protein